MDRPIKDGIPFYAPSLMTAVKELARR